MHGTSRFASTALLLCERCVASFGVELDKHCPPHLAGDGAESTRYLSDPARPTRCMGSGLAYSATNEYDPSGTHRWTMPFL